MSRKGLIAIAAVIDVAINERARPVSAKALAARHQLPPRLEPVLQALVRDGILKGIRGPHGGYELGRERRSITANDILRAAITVEDTECTAKRRGPGQRDHPTGVGRNRTNGLGGTRPNQY
jgi:Rrf2 family protein